jgi:predicted esterase
MTSPRRPDLTTAAALLALLVACGDPLASSASTDAAADSANDAKTDTGLPDATDASVDTTATVADTSLDAPIDTTPDVRTPPDIASPELPPPDTAPPKPTYVFQAAKCGDAPPPNAKLALPLPQPATGTCGNLTFDGKTHSTAKVKGVERKFLVLAPNDIKPGEKLPVLVAWYWLKGTAKKFIETGELANAVAQQRFVAILPESKGDIVIPLPGIKNPIDFPWPIITLSPEDRWQEEFQFFDAMLGCVATQLPLDKECVSVAGVSAGALFGAQLAAARSERIASFVSLSGGVWSSQPLTNAFLKKWPPPPHKLPALVLWGGPTDSCALQNFEAASKALEKELIAGNHFVVECVHNCGHGVPPIDAPQGQSKFASLWLFAWSHPYWLPPGASPYADKLPDVTPPWCAIGSGKATMRTGACGPPGCPI